MEDRCSGVVAPRRAKRGGVMQDVQHYVMQDYVGAAEKSDGSEWSCSTATGETSEPKEQLMEVEKVTLRT